MSNGDKSCWEKIKDAFKKEGDYIDWWTFVHMGFGFIMGILLNALGFSIIEGFFIVLILAIFWELIEPTVYKILRILFPDLDIPEEFPEKPTNSLVDIIVALVGFMFAKCLDSLIDMWSTGEWAPDFSLEAPNPFALLKIAVLTLVFYFLVVVPIRLAIQVRIQQAQLRKKEEPLRSDGEPEKPKE